MLTVSARVDFSCSNPFECGNNKKVGMLPLPLEEGQSNDMSGQCLAPACPYLRVAKIIVSESES